MRSSPFFFLLILLLSGCYGPRTTIMPKDEARRDQRVMQVKVVKIYDNSNNDYVQGPHVSHVIDVDVLDGPSDLIGKPLTLPFDQFYVAKPPPAVGEVVVTTPAAWVTRNADGKQRPFGQ
jgi:hypothetical protein